MPSLPTGRKIFRALNDLFDFPGTQGVRKVETGESFVTVPVTPFLQAEQTHLAYFDLALVRGSGGVGSSNVDLHIGTDWTQIVEHGRDRTEGVPDDHDALILEMGARVETGGTLNAISISTRQIGAGARRILLFYGEDEANNGQNVLNKSGSTQVNPVPHFYPNADEQTHELLLLDDVSAATTIRYLFKVLHAPKGVLPRF